MTPKRHLTLVTGDLTNQAQPGSLTVIDSQLWLHTNDWAFKLNEQHKHLYKHGLNTKQLPPTGGINLVLANDNQFETVGTTQNTLLLDLYNKLQTDQSWKVTERFGFDAEQNTPITMIGIHNGRLCRIFYVSDIGQAFLVDETWLQVATAYHTLCYMTATQKYGSTHHAAIGFWGDDQQLEAIVTARQAFI